MKKILALILAIMLILSALCGCSDKSTGDGGSKGDSVATTDPSPESDAGGKNEQKTYTDLPETEQIGLAPLYVNGPSLRLDYGENFFTLESKNYFIVAVTDNEQHPDESIDDAFSAFYNEELTSVLKYQIERATYDDFTPEKTERVTLSCGAEALKFEGTQTADDYGTARSFPVYGYAFFYNDYPIIMLSIVTDIEHKDQPDDAKRVEMNNYVDEMVQTIRSER